MKKASIPILAVDDGSSHQHFWLTESVWAGLWYVAGRAGQSVPITEIVRALSDYQTSAYSMRILEQRQCVTSEGEGRDQSFKVTDEGLKLAKKLRDTAARDDRASE